MSNKEDYNALAALKRFFVEQHKEYPYACFYAYEILLKIADIEAANEFCIDELMEIKTEMKKEENA